MSPRRSATPRFSIVTPVYDPPVDVLKECIESVIAQDFEDWELIMVDDFSSNAAVPIVIAQYAQRDPRITLVERDVNGHIVAASNDGVAAAAGEFIALLDHDDLLVPHALTQVVNAIDRHDDVDYLYTDEDKVGADGTTYGAFHKPDWSPERLRGQMYTSHLSVLRTSLVREVGGFREGFEGSQDHDLVLRVTERARRVVHVPEVLYHWRAVEGSTAVDIEAKPYAETAGIRAVQEHLDRLGIDAVAGPGAEPGRYVVDRRLSPDVRVSVVIPTAGQSSIVRGVRRVLVVDAVRSLLEHTEHADVEVVVVHDSHTPPGVLDELRAVAGDRLVDVPFDRPFNFSEKINVGVCHASGERLVFLNDDVEVISPRWLEQLVAPLDEEDVGLTGAKLYFSDQTVQHAGHAYYNAGYHHPFKFWTRDEVGPFGELVVNREVTGVTAACAAMRRDVFFEVGGFSEALPGNFNDVDLCYKVAASGRRTVFVATCELYHYESRTRESRVHEWERLAVVSRWGVPDEDAFTPRAVAMPNLRRVQQLPDDLFERSGTSSG
ncbi:glycosyltransferase [Nocardioides sp. zg-1308]|uniref:glycosyltransferase n=1 Tax=Nocardioides TaxID=1839 RepID=UPI00155347DA|nr:glycosyltransferase [Nocardioides sp. S-34]NPD03279.1 glycosyltransferase [Nocardioides sp. zg-1308]WQQ21170.1 glycosyltransferase [Nocardioides sp. S-34]